MVESVVKRVLLIAFHYPPFKGSSGLQRTLRYSAYLHHHGWQAEVLTVKPMAYATTGDDELGDIPPHVPVHRAWALNARKHLSIFGRYPSALASPDPWMSWQFDGVRKGRKLLREKSFDAIWSTYPIVTAHRIGSVLAAESGLPWVADFRDLMACEDWPLDADERNRLQQFQRQIVDTAARCVLTTPGATRHYQAMYPDVTPEKFVYLPNGYHEPSFCAAIGAAGSEHDVPASNEPFVLLHAGILYPSERDPKPFFKALSVLKANGAISASTFQVRLRATGHDDYYRPILEDFGVSDLVELAPALPYKDVLKEMMASSGLLIFQAANCNEQIPAKLYEYFRAGRPIVALTDAAGDTAATIKEEGAGVIAQIDDCEDIVKTLSTFLQSTREGSVRPMTSEQILKYSRENQAADFAQLLDAVAAP